MAGFGCCDWYMTLFRCWSSLFMGFFKGTLIESSKKHTSHHDSKSYQRFHWISFDNYHSWVIPDLIHNFNPCYPFHLQERYAKVIGTASWGRCLVDGTNCGEVVDGLSFFDWFFSSLGRGLFSRKSWDGRRQGACSWHNSNVWLIQGQYIPTYLFFSSYLAVKLSWRLW